MSEKIPDDWLYPQQFIIGPAFAEGFPSWKRLRLSDTLYITSHPELKVTQVSNQDESLALIGYLIDPLKASENDRQILEHLLLENSTSAEVIRSTYGLCGNWVLICKKIDETILFNDCTGAKSVYYTDIKTTNEKWFASQPRLIARLLGLVEDTKALDFMRTQKTRTDDYWWPGDTSAYPEIRALLPNHYYDLKNNKIIRYWPNEELTTLGEADGLEKISHILKGIMSAAANRYDLALALSSGLDSRVMLAASRDLMARICVYNGKRPEMSKGHPDIAVARRLTQKLNMQYHYIPQRKTIDDAFRQAYTLNAPDAITQLVPGLQAELKYFNKAKVGATGNILETARYYYKIYDPKEYPPSGKFLAAKTKMNEALFAVEAFDSWLGGIGELYNINIYDLFYWEQRCGRWLSNNTLVFGMAWAEVLFPFNCRNLLVDLLSIPGKVRMPVEYQFFRSLIHYMWPELLSEEINPMPKPGLSARIKNRLRRIVN